MKIVLPELGEKGGKKFVKNVTQYQQNTPSLMQDLSQLLKN